MVKLTKMHASIQLVRQRLVRIESQRRLGERLRVRIENVWRDSWWRRQEITALADLAETLNQKP